MAEIPKGLIEIDGKPYRVLLSPQHLTERDIVDFSPRASLPAGGNIGYSELMLYQPIVQDDWSGGLGFPQHTNGSGFAYAEGSIETSVAGLLMLNTAPTESDTNNTRKDGLCLFLGKVYGWGPSGVRRYSGGSWADVYTAGGVNHMLANGKYLFLLPDGAAGTKATGSITFVSQPNTGDKVHVGRKIYTFRTALTAPQVADEILIGASKEASATNLKQTVNKEGTEGTTYSTGTAENPHVSASVASAVVTLTARRAGVWGNSIVVVTDGARLTDTNLGSGAAGGKGDIAAGLITIVTNPTEDDTTVIGTVTYRWKDKLTGAKNHVKIGASKAESAKNLRKAINDEGTEGSHYGSGTEVHPRVEAMADTQAANPTVRLLAKAFGAQGNGITLTVDGARLTKTDLTGGADGARVLKSESGDSGTWSVVGVDQNPPCDMKMALVHGGYLWFVEDGTSFVHYTAEEDASTLEGGGKVNLAVTRVGIGQVPVKQIISFNNVLYAGTEEALFANDPANGFVWKPVLDFKPERHSENFASIAAFRGFLYFTIRNDLYRWNGSDAFRVSPPPISDTYPPIQYGRWRNLTVRGNHLYASARTNETLWVERVLKFDGGGWHNEAEAVVNGADVVTAVFNDTTNEYLWYHVNRAGSNSTYYVQKQALSDLPYANHPTTGTHRWYSSKLDCGFKWVPKSMRSVKAITKSLPNIPIPAGPKLGGTFADLAGVGTEPWTNPSNAGADDAAYASVSVNSGDQSHYLKATNFSFAVPTGATVLGVVFTFEGYSVDTSAATVGLKLVVGGAVAGNSLHDYSSWGTSPTRHSFGSPSNLWGNTLTPAIVNASDFGVAISANCIGGAGAFIYLDYLTLTVYYDIADYFTLEYNPDETGWKTLGNIAKAPLQELKFAPSIEFFSVQFRITPVAQGTAQSPILDALVGLFLLRPDVAYGWSFTIVAASDSDGSEEMDQRVAEEIVADIKAARASKGPLRIVTPRGDAFLGYVSTVNLFGQAYEEAEGGTGIEWQVRLGVLELP